MGDTGFVVMDVGGTTTRTGHYLPDGRVTGVRRVPTAGIGLDPGTPVADLQRRVVEQIAAEAETTLIASGASAVGIAFAGPVTTAGRVLAGPTVWGGGGVPIDLADLLRDRLGVPVTVVNDLTAAVWRYVSGPGEPPFCLVTVSSGIGNKVYWDGRVLLDEGHGGELGHWTWRTDADAPPCDCGGRGHLGGIASGRGVLAAARSDARYDHVSYGPRDRLTNEILVAAVRAGDPLATETLRTALRPLAAALTSVFCAIGVRRFRVIGGFATAIGARYAELLTEALHEAGCFGLSPAEIDGLVTMGEPDDDHSLLGAGRLLTLDGVAG
ncbi:ROK family protein [Hamadaea tsunoensis]|uniref:ROK family protein n=1 Tax=Hamadaea tsunoensis TaxID=53368 RepID=UPI0003F698A0|nr:ROK family protein [Hamadaea tsunoensis]